MTCASDVGVGGAGVGASAVGISVGATDVSVATTAPVVAVGGAVVAVGSDCCVAAAVGVDVDGAASTCDVTAVFGVATEFVAPGWLLKLFSATNTPARAARATTARLTMGHTRERRGCNDIGLVGYRLGAGGRAVCAVEMGLGCGVGDVSAWVCGCICGCG